MKTVWMSVLIVVFAISTAGAQQYVYPAKGQTPEQQQAAFGKAKAACLEGKGYAVK